MEQWTATCNGCNEEMKGWATFHQEVIRGEVIFVAYCYECDHMDSGTEDKKGKIHWTLRVRCNLWNDDWTQCTNTYQSCRDKGSSLHVKCLDWWGGGRVGAIGGSAQHTPKQHWRRSIVIQLSAHVVNCTQRRRFRLQPLRLAVPRRLLALDCWLIEHHIPPLQPDVIKPEARYIENGW